jgi:Cdc6-like AAA superfamily ATPase
MAPDDPLGLAREAKIKKAGVRAVFTPHLPINTFKLFWGRQKEIQKLIEHINTPGQHALLYGDRGVGKSSLANVVCELLLSKLISGKFFSKRCDSSDTFQTVLEEPLRDVGYEPLKKGSSTQSSSKGVAGVNLPMVSAKLEASRQKTEEFDAPSISPSSVATLLATKDGLLLIDEADAIASPNDKKKLAELIKLLSDCGSPFKILVVGIAETADSLTGGHPSVQRCLKETKLQRMKGDELGMIIKEGGKKLGIEFDNEVAQTIVRLSAGYPHFTHLLALKCAEDAVDSGRKKIDSTHLQRAMNSAVEDAEGALRRKYDTAIRSSNTEMYRTVLHAAANIHRVEFSAEVLRTEVEKLTGKKITQQSLANYLNRLVAEDGTAVLQRKSKGVYRFTDPRMPSFVKIVNNDVS